MEIYKKKRRKMIYMLCFRLFPNEIGSPRRLPMILFSQNLHNKVDSPVYARCVSARGYLTTNVPTTLRGTRDW